MLSAGNVIEENNLLVFVSLNLLSFGSVTGGIFSRIDIDDLSISLVSEQQASFTVGINSEVRRVIEIAILGVPIVV
jgi:hypothetical protein